MSCLSQHTQKEPYPRCREGSSHLYGQNRVFLAIKIKLKFSNERSSTVRRVIGRRSLERKQSFKLTQESRTAGETSGPLERPVRVVPAPPPFRLCLIIPKSLRDRLFQQRLANIGWSLLNQGQNLFSQTLKRGQLTQTVVSEHKTVQKIFSLMIPYESHAWITHRVHFNTNPPKSIKPRDNVSSLGHYLVLNKKLHTEGFPCNFDA